MGILGAVSSWPVPTAAAAIVGPEGIIDAVGPIERDFYLASVTKPLVSLAMLVAVEEGAIELSDALPKDSIAPGATLRHLLSHASGIAFDQPVRFFAAEERRVYSNVGIEIAGELTAAAVQMPLASYFDEAVIQPLKLGSTSLPGSPAYAARSCVADVARVVQELLAPTGLLSESTLKTLRTVQFPGLRGVLPGFGSQNPNDWGLGFEVRGTKSPHWTGASNTPAAYGHFGQSGTFFWVEPELKIGLVALTDRSFGPWAAQAWPRLSDDVLASLG